jgi:hypothetical protein
MPESVSVDKAYAAYIEALHDLNISYSGPADLKIRSTRRVGSADIMKSSQSVLDQSRIFGDALVSALGTGDLDKRELVGWKLLAAAASDISIASDLLEAQNMDHRTETRRKVRISFETIPILSNVLETPMDTVPSTLAEPTRRILFLPMEPEAALGQLRKTIAVFLDEIPDSATSMSEAAVTEIIMAGLSPVKHIFSGMAQDIMKHLPSAAFIFAEAIRKIEAVLGNNVTGQLKDEVISWFKNILGEHDTIKKLLDGLYETKRIGKEVNIFLDSAPENTQANCYNQATKTLEDLMARYAINRKIIDGIMKVLEFAKTPLLAAVPWGPAGVYGTYLGVLTFSVFSGGDYLDWYRLNEKAWLDRVSGLRTTVYNSIGKEGLKNVT